MILVIFSVQYSFFTDLQRVHWAQDSSCYQGKLIFALNSKWNFLWWPPKLFLVSKSLCVVWHACCQPVPSLNLLLGSLHPSFTHPDTHPPSMVPWVCRPGSGTCHQLWSSSSPGCAPCLLEPCCYSYWSWSLHKETQLFMHRSRGRDWQLHCNVI